MINIREILANLYADRSTEDLYAILDGLQLLEPVKRIVTQLNAVIEEEHKLLQDCKMLPVGHIAGNLLSAINKRIAAEGNPEKAKELENTLGDISLRILLTFLDKIKSDKAAVWMQIYYALKDSCDFHNYDFNQLIRLLKIETAASYLQSRKSSDTVVLFNPVPSFCWKGARHQQKDFLDIFIDHGLAKNKKNVIKLFDAQAKSLELQLDPALADLILQFFYTVKNRKLVTHTGAKGFYQALEYHVLDFRKEFLKNSDARKRINSLKQSKSKWDANQQRIDSWLQIFRVTASVHRTVLQT